MLKRRKSLELTKENIEQCTSELKTVLEFLDSDNHDLSLTEYVDQKEIYSHKIRAMRNAGFIKITKKIIPGTRRKYVATFAADKVEPVHGRTVMIEFATAMNKSWNEKAARMRRKRNRERKQNLKQFQEEGIIKMHFPMTEGPAQPDHNKDKTPVNGSGNFVPHQAPHQENGKARDLSWITTPELIEELKKRGTKGNLVVPQQVTL